VIRIPAPASTENGREAQARSFPNLNSFSFKIKKKLKTIQHYLRQAIRKKNLLETRILTYRS
jgi:hypothetical protein